MKILTFSEVDTALWDAIQARSDQAWLFHSAHWVQIETAHFVRQNLSFAVCDDAGMAGIQPLYLSECGVDGWLETLVHSGIHRHTGLALAPGLDPKAVRAVQRATLAHILDTAERIDSDRIQLNIHNLAPRSLCVDREEIPHWVEAGGFQLGLHFGPSGMLPAPGLTTCNADQIVDLSPPEAQLFDALDDSCRRAVRKASSRNLELVAAASRDDVERYYTIAQASARRTNEALPPIDYYLDIWDRLGPARQVALLFARRGQVLAAGLILLIDKSNCSFLAGASLPEELPNRVNDFLHWSAMIWAKRTGLSRYRFGPSFPEVPAQWPIARVSRFKTKFGAASRTIIQGSLFRHPAKYASVIATHADHLVAPPAPREAEVVSPRAGELERDVVSHHLSLMGWPREAERPRILFAPGEGEVESARAAMSSGIAVIALRPDHGFCTAFGVACAPGATPPPATLTAAPGAARRGIWDRVRSLASNTYKHRARHLRTLHAYDHYTAQSGSPMVFDGENAAAWLWQPIERSGVLLIGTDLAGDLVRYRQGDPNKALSRDTQARWGYAGERPNYLFEAQRSGEPAHVRHADEWAFFFAETLATLTATALGDVLPGGAVGALVITGDDDQASLGFYDQQRQLLGDTPITYYLHPLSKHSHDTIEEMRRNMHVDFGLHPDALEAPERYADLFTEQTRWYSALLGETPLSVRNHGFLNDGYWGHLDTWLKAKVRMSSNLPGLDGNVLNGSLLPARVAYNGGLTDHWSVLTLIGDGAVFVNNWGAEQSAQCVFDAADRVRASGIPGVIVLNLHPENVARAAGMHRAAIEVARSGFVAWTMRECHEWFNRQG